MILPVFTDYLFWLTVVLVKVADLTQKLEQRTEWVDILPVPYYRSANLSQENQCSFFLNARSCSLNMTIVAINFPPLLVQISASQRNPPQLSHPYVLGPILLFFHPPQVSSSISMALNTFCLLMVPTSTSSAHICLLASILIQPIAHWTFSLGCPKYLTLNMP